MKKISVAMVVLLFATLTFAQRVQPENVPANVRSAFQDKYPSVTKIKWDKEGELYEAGFDLNKKAHSVLMDIQGHIMETEVEMELGRLPKGILEFIKTNYAGKKAKEAAVITDVKGTVTYEVEIKGMDLIFSADGTFIKEVKG